MLRDVLEVPLEVTTPAIGVCRRVLQREWDCPDLRSFNEPKCTGFRDGTFNTHAGRDECLHPIILVLKQLNHERISFRKGEGFLGGAIFVFSRGAILKCGFDTKRTQHLGELRTRPKFLSQHFRQNTNGIRSKLKRFFFLGLDVDEILLQHGQVKNQARLNRHADRVVNHPHFQWCHNL
ncbi:hypothetical protein D3C86_1376530 [compost metagenome]